MNDAYIGSCPENGSYDGLIGLVQRKEVDAIVTPVRYDSTPHEPGKFILHFDPISAIYIYSTPKFFSRFVCKIEHCNSFVIFKTIYMRFSEIICCNILISLLIVVISSTFVQMTFFDSVINVKACVQSVFSSVYFVCKVNMKQAKRWTLKRIKSVNLIFLIITILTFFMSLISLHFFRELLFPFWGFQSFLSSISVLLHDPKYSNVKPVMSNHGQVESVLRLSRHGTDEKSIFEKMSDRSIFSYAEMFAELNEQSQRRGGFHDFMYGKLAVIEERSVANRLIPALCQIFPDFDIRRSNYPILPAAQALLLSSELDYKTVKLIAYRAKTWYEMGFNNYKLSRYPHTIEPLGYGPSFGIRLRQCTDNANRIRDADYRWKALMVNLDWFEYRRSHQDGEYRTTRYICIFLFIISTVTLIFEKIIFYSLLRH